MSSHRDNAVAAQVQCGEPTTDYRLLADVMLDASGYFEWKKGRFRLMQVMLKFSYIQNQPQASFPSHEVLKRHTGMNEKRLSEALTDLVCCGVAMREGKGRGGLILTPLPDYQKWGLPSIAAEYADKEYVASLVRYTVHKSAKGYVALPYPVEAVDPVTQHALA